MRTFSSAAAAAVFLALAACGGQGDDKLGDQAADAAEAQGEQLDTMADQASGAQEDALEAQADAVRAGGEAKEEAIDEADVNADAMSDEQKKQIVNGR